MLIFGFLAFPLIITGVVLNTIFLVREIRRNEQHDAFINAVTHELKTPVASIRLYLQTLQSRPIDDPTAAGVLQVMLEDTDRLVGTIDQVLRAARVGAKLRRASPVPIDLSRDGAGLPCPGADAPSSAGRGADLPRVAGRRTGAGVGRRRGSEGGGVEPRRQRGQVPRVRRCRWRWSSIRPNRRRPRCACAIRASASPRASSSGSSNASTAIPGAVATRVKGTGLGLFIVRSVVARHGGKVFAESDGLGRGSTFTVQLPLSPPR